MSLTPTKTVASAVLSAKENDNLNHKIAPFNGECPF